MSYASDFTKARGVATEFLDRIKSGVASLSKQTPRNHTVGECSGVFWWDGNSPLFEFSLLTGEGVASGYVIVSCNESLLPIHEYSLTGVPYSIVLNRYLMRWLAVRGWLPRQVRWYYLGPFDPVAEVTLVGSEKTHYVSVPSLKTHSVSGSLIPSRGPKKLYREMEVADGWKFIRERRDAKETASQFVLDIKPVKYQQSCSFYNSFIDPEPIDDSGDYCKAVRDDSGNHACIMGCTPVAWGVLASCYKQFADPFNVLGNPAAKIYPGSSCWMNDWDSTSNPMPRCSDVENAIWNIHGLTSTTCDGSCSSSNRLLAAQQFRDWGLHWQWSDDALVDFDLAKKIVLDNKPFIFSGDGEWESFFMERRFQEAAPGEPSTSAHSVVVYGVDSATNMVLVCLGWGKLFEDKWVPVNAITNRFATYVKRYQS